MFSKRSYILAICLFITMTGLAMDPVDAVCKKMKQIKASAHPSEYRALVAQLQQEGKTVCECIKQLTWTQKENATKALVPDYEGEKAWYPTFNISIECDKTIPKELCDEVKQAYETKKQENVDFYNTGYVMFDSSYPGAAKTVNIVGNFDQFYLEINPLVYQKLNKDERIAVLKHELKHVQLGHNHTNAALTNQAHSNPQTFSKFRRIQEKEADRISAACDESYVPAQGQESFYEKELKLFLKSLPAFKTGACDPSYKFAENNQLFKSVKQKILQKNMCAMNQQEFSKNLWRILDPDHPHAQKNLLWAIKIKRLREAEEKLKSKS